MPKYILKRIVGTIPTLIIVVTFVFFFVRLIPGDPARLVAGEQATKLSMKNILNSKNNFFIRKNHSLQDSQTEKSLMV